MSQTKLQRFQNYAMRPNTNIKWSIAHGRYTDPSRLRHFSVPEGVYVSLVSVPGFPVSKNIIYHPTFHTLHRNIRLTKEFIRHRIPMRNLPTALRYFYSKNPRIYLPGDSIADLELEYKDPDPYTNIFLGVKSLKHHSKSFTNSSVHLSNILNRPGVYFIIACRGTTNNTTRMTMQRHEMSLAQSLRKRPRNTMSLRRNANQPSAKKR
jgi:hypothetical protein